MVTRRDIDPLWQPSDKLNEVWRELKEAQQWLEGRRMTGTASTLLPEDTVTPVRGSNPRGRVASPAKLPADSTPRGKTATPTKLPAVSTLTKMGARPNMDSGGQPARSA